MSDIKTFCQTLPKIELHAHLTGSISRKTLHEIWLQKQDQQPNSTTNIEDPLVAIPANKVDFDLATFFPLFTKYTYLLVNDIPSITYSTQAVLNDFSADGVIYLELRTTPRAFPATGLTKQTYLNTILSVINASNASPTTRLHTTLILSIDRRNTIDQAIETVNLAISLRDAGNPVVGIDLCGDPSIGDVAIFEPAFTKAREHGLPITLHFGEIINPPTMDELDILLSFEPARLGHVIHTTSEICEEIVRRGIGLELCVSCNICAKMLPDHTDLTSVVDHHFKYWWGKWRECRKQQQEKGQGDIKQEGEDKRERLRIVLCTDDVGVFLSPVSNELAIVSDGFGLMKKDIWEMMRGGVEIIFGGEDEKVRLRKRLDEYKY